MTPLHLPLRYSYILHFQSLAIPSAVLLQKLGLLCHTTRQPGRTAGKPHLLHMWSSPCTGMETCKQKPALEFLKIMSNKTASILPEIFLPASLPQELYYSFLGHTAIPTVCRMRDPSFLPCFPCYHPIMLNNLKRTFSFTSGFFFF